MNIVVFSLFADSVRDPDSLSANSENYIDCIAFLSTPAMRVPQNVNVGDKFLTAITNRYTRQSPVLFLAA